MNHPSPRTPVSTPGRDWEFSRMSSATPTPSPRPNWLDSSTPRRPATRAAHSRGHSYSQQSTFSPRSTRESPRYNSYGEYATVEVSPNNFSSAREQGPMPSSKPHRSSAHANALPKRDRRHSYTYVRASTPYGESDEDEIIEAMGRTFVLPAEARSRDRRRGSYHQLDADVYVIDGVRYTNDYGYPQGAPYHHHDVSHSSREPSYDSPPPARPQPQSRPPTSHSHARRSSASVPQRPSTVRPPASNSYRAKPPPPPKATEADARRYRIPPGYSLKNWDPTEEPILLLGSVFDANSLGKWIYDWTVYREGPATPIADMAGELWLLLIQFSGKLKRAEDTVGRIRNVESRELVSEFIDGGERTMDKLRGLLKSCEAPMLKAARKKQAGLGKNSGVEFVDTLFGRDRELSKTEKLMQMVRLFNLRFDANCDEILRNPTI